MTQATDLYVRDPRNIVERLVVGIPRRAEAFGIQPRRTETGRAVTRGPGRADWRCCPPSRRSRARAAQRRCAGSRTAQEDAEITRAVNAVASWERDPKQYERPTSRQRMLANRYGDRENEAYLERASAERVRRRQRGGVRDGPGRPDRQLPGAEGPIDGEPADAPLVVVDPSRAAKHGLDPTLLAAVVDFEVVR